ncbi:MAG TPA: hypothetical protein VEA40_15430 [Ramlibacter sp.]|nr:hypothetical protein [Ramlibacter sp.]
MHSTYEIPLLPPEPGQQYLDVEGRRWSVQEVLRLGGPAKPDWYLLRMAFHVPGQPEARLVVSKHEFLRLAGESGLRPVVDGG